jgi:hypothetical protein
MSEDPHPMPAHKPQPEPKGPRTPYPVDEPPETHGPGSEHDYLPGNPTGGDLPKM